MQNVNNYKNQLYQLCTIGSWHSLWRSVVAVTNKKQRFLRRTDHKMFFSQLIKLGLIIEHEPKSAKCTSLAERAINKQNMRTFRKKISFAKCCRRKCGLQCCIIIMSVIILGLTSDMQMPILELFHASLLSVFLPDVHKCYT